MVYYLWMSLYHKIILEPHQCTTNIITDLVLSVMQEAKDTHILSAQVFTSYRETGVAVLTKSNRIFMVNNIHEPKTRKYPDLPGGLCLIMTPCGYLLLLISSPSSLLPLCFVLLFCNSLHTHIPPLALYKCSSQAHSHQQLKKTK